VRQVGHLPELYRTDVTFDFFKVTSKSSHHRLIIKQCVVKNNRLVLIPRDISYLENEGGTKRISERYVTTQPTDMASYPRTVEYSSTRLTEA
jgi:hypothetical protein